MPVIKATLFLIQFLAHVATPMRLDRIERASESEASDYTVTPRTCSQWRRPRDISRSIHAEKTRAAVAVGCYCSPIEPIVEGSKTLRGVESDIDRKGSRNKCLENAVTVRHTEPP